MHADERDIFAYLKGWPDQFVSQAEICRRAGGKWRFREDPNWAIPILSRMVEEGKLESDSTGHYRLRKPTEKQKPKRWLSPQMRKLIRESGKKFEGLTDIELEEDRDGAEPGS